MQLLRYYVMPENRFLLCSRAGPFALGSNCQFLNGRQGTGNGKGFLLRYGLVLQRCGEHLDGLIGIRGHNDRGRKLPASNVGLSGSPHAIDAQKRQGEELVTKGSIPEIVKGTA